MVVLLTVVGGLDQCPVDHPLSSPICLGYGFTVLYWRFLATDRSDETSRA